MISIIEPSPHDAATAYVAATCYKSDDTAPVPVPHRRLRRDLDADHQRHPRRRVHARDPRRPGAARPAVLRHRDAASTSRSTTASTGSAWRPICRSRRSGTWSSRAPTWSPRTHGRSFWILDDITPLHQLQAEIALEAAHLFKPRDTVRFRMYGRALRASRRRTSTTR